MNVMSLFFVVTTSALLVFCCRTADAALAYCGNDPCDLELQNHGDDLTSCTEALAAYDFFGTCCSLVDDEDSCRVRISSGVCYWYEKGTDGLSCTDYGDGSFGCVPSYTQYETGSTEPCPDSIYDALGAASNPQEEQLDDEVLLQEVVGTVSLGVVLQGFSVLGLLDEDSVTDFQQITAEHIQDLINNRNAVDGLTGVSVSVTVESQDHVDDEGAERHLESSIKVSSTVFIEYSSSSALSTVGTHTDPSIAWVDSVFDSDKEVEAYITSLKAAASTVFAQLQGVEIMVNDTQIFPTLLEEQEEPATTESPPARDEEILQEVVPFSEVPPLVQPDATTTIAAALKSSSSRAGGCTNAAVFLVSIGAAAITTVFEMMA